MIIWLASYPKSGNTWIRSFLNSLLFTKDGEAEINNINISQFPNRRHFNKLVENLDDFTELSKNWITAQDIINLDNKIKFMKTHHIMCSVGGNSFTNLDNTLGIIHIVRDPRNIITSVLNHYSKTDYDDALNFMTDQNRVVGRDPSATKDFYKEAEIITLISSWNNHYNSWKKIKKNNYLLKYEDLVENPVEEFGKLCNFISKISNISFEKKKIIQSINSNKFENLKKIEKSQGFVEGRKNKFSGKEIPFFNQGPNNNWGKNLTDEIKTKIENEFKSEMLELGYLK